MQSRPYHISAESVHVYCSYVTEIKYQPDIVVFMLTQPVIPLTIPLLAYNLPFGHIYLVFNLSLFVCYSNNRLRIRSYQARNCSPCINQVSILTYHVSILVHSQPEAVVPAVGSQIVLLNVVQVTLPDHTPVVVIIITGVVREITKGN